MKLLNHPLLYLSIILIAIPLYLGTQQVSPKSEEDLNDLPTRRELFQSLREKGQIILVYPESDSSLKMLAEQLSELPSRRTRLLARADQSLTETEIKDNVLMLLGTPWTNKITELVLPELPLQVTEECIVFDRKKYRDLTTVISLPFYPNPMNSKIPLMIMTATNNEAIIQLLKQKYTSDRSLFRWSSWGYEIYQNNCRLLMGQFDEHDWALTKTVHFDYTHKLDTLLQTANYQFISHHCPVDPTYLEQVANSCEQAAKNILSFTNGPSPQKQIAIHLYRSAEDKGLMWANTDQAHMDMESHSVHVVFNEIYQDNIIGKENQVLIRQLLGKPSLAVLENGLAVYFTQHWQVKGYDYWATRLFQSDNTPPLTEILDNKMQAEDSRLVLGCLSASFVEFLIQYWGKERFLANYIEWEPTAAEIHGLETDWHDYLATKTVAARHNRTDAPLPYLKGFNFAHEGYNIYNGFISRMATESLKKQLSLNANAAAIIPYSYIPDPKKPSYIGISNGAGSENDESIVHAAFQAKKLGMTTMLKPQIWLGRGSWPGDVEMQTEADWQQFFEHYYRWIRHYALMAEMYQMDILCIGTEFAKATLQREEDWRQMIRKIRQLYSGKITYAANWGEEFEQLAFWDELDYIGLDCYYPLSKKEDPTKKELAANFKAVMKKMETVSKRYQKPLIFTEIGFRSIDAPWKNPHADSGDAAFNGVHQKLCYETIFESIQGKDWCQGIFWWKFPTDSDNMGWEQKGFTPNRKPAEEVVKKWFGKLK